MTLQKWEYTNMRVETFGGQKVTTLVDGDGREVWIYDVLNCQRDQRLRISIGMLVGDGGALSAAGQAGFSNKK